MIRTRVGNSFSKAKNVVNDFIKNNFIDMNSIDIDINIKIKIMVLKTV